MPGHSALPLSVVVPVYRNSGTLAALHGRIVDTLAGRFAGFEVVYVNDACPAGSRAVLDTLASGDVRARVRHLPRNVGQHRAILEGLKAAIGDVVVIMDADLQDPPEAIPRLLEALDAGFDVTFAGRRGAYHGSAVRGATSRLFKRLQTWLTGVPADAGAFVALRRPVVGRLLAMPPGPQTVVAMIGFSGGRMTSVPTPRAPRPAGRSAFSSRMRLGLGWRTLLWAARMRLAGRSR